MSTPSSNINICIIGKPNSGKSTLFNCLIKKNISPVGEEYGLTKQLIKDQFVYNNQSFTIIDTPGLRRKSKINDIDEIQRNREAIKLIGAVDTVLLLIDSLESFTKQDFRLADLAINKKKIIFFLFNKQDILDDKNKFQSKIYKYLKNNYGQYRMVNIEFISAKRNQRITSLLKQLINKTKIKDTKIKKSKLNKFLNHLIKQDRFPKVKKIEIRPKYIVQLNEAIPSFKVFINSKNRAPLIFTKYFDSSFRNYFKLEGIPINFKFISSKNPYLG